MFWIALSAQIAINWILDYHPPAKYLQILQWDSSVPEQDQDQCNKTVRMKGKWGWKHKQTNTHQSHLVKN